MTDPDQSEPVAPDTIDNRSSPSNDRPEPLQAETFLKGWGSASYPAALRVVGGGEYVVKSTRTDRDNQRVMFNDQVVARLGQAIGAPVGEPSLVTIPEDLTKAEQHLHAVAPGTVGHGTRYIADSNPASIGSYNNPENKRRAALLAILYGLCQAGDLQVIFENQEPRRVHSVDHGHFFPNGPNWTADSLKQANPAVPDATIKAAYQLADDEINEALAALQKLDPSTIKDIVDMPPDAWGVSAAERQALVEYLHKRREQLLAQLPATRKDPKL